MEGKMGDATDDEEDERGRKLMMMMMADDKWWWCRFWAEIECDDEEGFDDEDEFDDDDDEHDDLDTEDNRDWKRSEEGQKLERKPLKSDWVSCLLHHFLIWEFFVISFKHVLSLMANRR